MSGQRVHAGEQVVLTGSAFHIPKNQMIEALWVTLPRHSRYPQIVKYLAIRAALATFARKAGQAGMFPFKSCACLARPACLAQISRTTTKEGAADVEALGGQRERIPHRDLGAKLPNYIWQVFECKAGRARYSQRSITHSRSGSINKDSPCRSLASSCFS